MSTHKLSKFLSALQSSFIGSEQVYTNGSCYKLYEVVKVIFPEAKAIHFESHIYIDYAGSYWDINGEVTDDWLNCAIKDNGEDITDDPDIAEIWKFDMYNMEIECPRCDEPFARAELEPKHIEQTRKRYGN